MSDYTTAARPYARAAFELAKDNKILDQWSKDLAFMAAVAKDETMLSVLDSPKLTHTERADIFLKVCKGKIKGLSENIVRLLAENRRLQILPDIAELFEVFRSEAEKHIEATLITAHKVTDKESKAIIAALEKRFDQKISLNVEIDPDLIGGAIIKAGDKVIDGSLKTRMNELAASLLR